MVDNEKTKPKYINTNTNFYINCVVGMKSGTEEYKQYWRDYYAKNKEKRKKLISNAYYRRKGVLGPREIPWYRIFPYHCKICGIELTKDNWYDSRRETNKHGRMFICRICNNKKNKELHDMGMGKLRIEWFDECVICNLKYDGMIFHEINWITHNNKNYPNFYKDNFNKFIYVCKRCHQLIHQLHNITDKEIEEILIDCKWRMMSIE